ncbi:testis-expressed protein 264 [Strongylocentrotus purpuratus]|uniref:Testis-expressed sequence 264 protein n=1 Tax=Strongylocentrotus purpuratus TaxID=7668 RepID=A0A7M7NPF0_STRPU|nr:testis-expressed protein 264 [Strongylocentrotus purpuratus]
MDPLLLGIIALVIALILTIALLVVHTGIFRQVDVNTGRPPIANVRVAYKFARGPYSECGPMFSEVASLAPDLRCIGVYFDDPQKVESYNQRYIVGTILSEGTSEVDKEVEARLVEHEFKLTNFPAVDHAVICSFPFIWTLSSYIATAKVWPQLGEYIEERKLCAHPAIEVYTGDEIQYMLPLSKQEDFYVEEAKKAKEEIAKSLQESDGKENESALPDDSTMTSSDGSDASSGSESSFEELSLKEGEMEEEPNASANEI